MPAPLAVDKEQVRMLVMSVGVAEAARRTGVGLSAVKQWSARGGWLESAAVTAQLVQGVTTPAKAALAETLPESMRPTPVTGLTNPADALAEALADDSRASRISLSRGLRRTAEHIAQLDPSESLEQAQNVKATVSSLATVHGWGESGQNVTVNVGLLTS